MKSQTAVFIQDACLEHHYIRSRDLSAIVERPERVRAVKLGLCAAIARLEEHSSTTPPEDSGWVAVSAEPATKTLSPNSTPEGSGTRPPDSEAEELAAALSNMKLFNSVTPLSVTISSTVLSMSPLIPVVVSSARAPLLSWPAIKYIHGDIGPNGDVYLNNLLQWAKESSQRISTGKSEIPEGFNQGDLYMCPKSVEAIEGAAGTACEAVDAVIAGGVLEGRNVTRAFVAIRPPGHHCGEDTPSGFCFVNNVAVAAAHAHLQHGIKNVLIFDIDLHHGNGTQSIIWQINEDTYREKLEAEGGAPDPKLGLQVYYGSVHDILSYPCEDGKVALVQAASVSIHGPHGQWIENVHLQPYTSEAEFWDTLYTGPYSRLLTRAEDFVKATSSMPEDTLIFISCGFDACEHEYQSMSRHGRKVPVGFYERFARDASAFADRYAASKLISILEGGYSDLALISGSLAHLVGLANPAQATQEQKEGWWSVDALGKIEKCLKKQRKGGKPSTSPSESWLLRTNALFAEMDSPLPPPPARTARSAVPSSMTLRGRKPKTLAPSSSDSGSPEKAVGRKSGVEPVKMEPERSSSVRIPASADTGVQASASVKKVSRVILHVRQPEA